MIEIINHLNQEHVMKITLIGLTILLTGCVVYDRYPATYGNYPAPRNGYYGAPAYDPRNYDGHHHHHGGRHYDHDHGEYDHHWH